MEWAQDYQPAVLLVYSPEHGETIRALPPFRLVELSGVTYVECRLEVA